MINEHHSRRTLWRSVGVFVLLMLAAIAFLYFYEQRLDNSISETKGELKKRIAKPELPKGQMEDGPVLEDLPTLSNVPVAVISKTDLIKIESLHAGDTILSPFTVTGQARGNWFFEASFPIKILDKDGNVIGQGVAQAEGEWMTENFVPWKATISFITPASSGGEVVFMKDNPSGLPEHDAEVRVPVVFAYLQ